MSYNLEIKQEAKTDIIEAATWYRKQQFGLDRKFVLAVETTLRAITNNPTAFKKVYKSFRQVAIKRFPYVINYEVTQNTIIVYTVFNTWQNPRKKIKRLKK